MQSMKQRYALSKRAEMDLANIWRYTLETWSREQANKYLQGLLNACSEIAISPNFLGRMIMSDLVIEDIHMVNM